MNKLELLQSLKIKYNHYNLAEIRRLVVEKDTVITELGYESWKSLSPSEKQKTRRLYLSEAQIHDQPIVYVYYENMIVVYDLLLVLLSKLEVVLNRSNIQGVEIGLLRISAIALIEKEFMDEYRLPKRHIGIKIFSNLTNEFHDSYPELNLKEFVDAYSTMYRYWPGKPNMTYEDAVSYEEKRTIYEVLSERLSAEGKLLKNYSAESYLISKKSLETTWKNLDTHKKQDKRRETWMRFKHNPESLIKSPYYETMILVYDQIIDLLEKLKNVVKDDQSIKNAELGHLRICAILQIEQDNMDENIIPKQHIQPRYITTLAEEYHTVYPDLNLLELSKAYTEMYEIWPDKPDYNRKPS